MRIDTLHVVTSPTKRSELADICFSTDYEGLARQFRGGLEAAQIIGIYTDRKEAEKIATGLLNIPDRNRTVSL